jgi:hypothetical protein
MKTLIVHPNDTSTSFLSTIYAHLRDKTVVKGGITKSDLRELIKSHDRMIMLGHGSPHGLLSVGQFPLAGFYIVDESIVSILRNKSGCIYIWCFADQFVQRHGLTGLCSGMFISEIDEWYIYGSGDVDQDIIDQSNEKFVSVVSKYIQEQPEICYKRLINEYGTLTKTNPVVRYNVDRLCLRLGDLTKRRKRIVIEE